MIKKTLLAAVAAIAMVAGAAAQTMDDTGNNDKQYYWFECSVASIQPQDKDKDPVYKINLYLDANDYNFVKVVHTLRSGKEVSRADQYTKNVDVSKNKNGASTWFGVHGKNPNLAMGGLFGVLKNGQWVYDEIQFMTGRKGPIMTMHSVCHQI